MTSNVNLKSTVPLVTLATELTGERFLLSVNQLVSLQVSSGRKGFSTALKGASIRFLSRMEPHVGL